MHAASPKGFAAVARDHAEAPLDLHRLMVPHPAATFFMRMQGEAMAPFIHPGDLLVVDRSHVPRDGQIAVVAAPSFDDRWIVRRWTRTAAGIVLRADNPKYPELCAGNAENVQQDFQLFGTVKWIVKDVGSSSGPMI